MEDYILIQKRRAKVTLLSCNNANPYTIQLTKKVAVQINPLYESWLITSIFQDDVGNVATWLRTFDNNVSPMEIDKWIKKFKDAHILQPIHYSFDKVPCVATSDTCCILYVDIFRHPIQLALSHETELLNIVKSHITAYDKQKQLIRWFKRFRERYGIECRLKRDMKLQDSVLAEVFCLIHGLNWHHLSLEEYTPTPTSPMPWYKQIGLAVTIIVIITLAFAVPICLMNHDWGTGWVGVVIFTVCCVWLYVITEPFRK